ncbi:hypothetical protein ACFL2V_15040 [Pseudomonadota bacterium]
MGERLDQLQTILEANRGKPVLFVIQEEKLSPGSGPGTRDLREWVNIQQEKNIGIIAEEGEVITLESGVYTISLSKRVREVDTREWGLESEPFGLNERMISNLGCILKKTTPEPFDAMNPLKVIRVYTGNDIENYFWGGSTAEALHTCGTLYLPLADEVKLRVGLDVPDELRDKYTDLSVIQAMELLGLKAPQRFYDLRKRVNTFLKEQLTQKIPSIDLTAIAKGETPDEKTLKPLIEQAVELGMHKGVTAPPTIGEPGIAYCLPLRVAHWAQVYHIELTN